MATFADLKDRAQNMALVEDDTLAGIFVNDVYTDLVVQGQLKCSSVTVPLASNANKYSVSDDFGITDFGMAQYLVYTASGMTEGYVLDQTDLETALQLNSTLPTGYVRKYAFQGLDSVYLWPYPQNGTRYPATNLVVHSNTFSTVVTGPSTNGVRVTNFANVSGTTYQLTTASAHGFSTGASIYVAIPHNQPGHHLTSLTPYTITVTGSTTFTLVFTGSTTTGAVSAGGVSSAPMQCQIYGLAQTGFSTFLVITSSGAYGYTPLANNPSVGNDGCWVYPSGSDSLTVYYSQTPTELAAAGDVPSVVPTQWQHLIGIGAAARLTDAVGEDIALATALQQKYDALYLAFVKWVRNRQGRGTQIMGHGYTRSVGWPPHDRSAYYSDMSGNV